MTPYSTLGVDLAAGPDRTCWLLYELPVRRYLIRRQRDREVLDTIYATSASVALMDWRWRNQTAHRSDVDVEEMARF